MSQRPPLPPFTLGTARQKVLAAEAADRGRALIDENPEASQLLYNVACCESRAGRADDAVEHLRRAIDGMEYLRALAAGDDDLAPIRSRPEFRQLVANAEQKP